MRFWGRLVPAKKKSPLPGAARPCLDAAAQRARRCEEKTHGSWPFVMHRTHGCCGCESPAFLLFFMNFRYDERWHNWVPPARYG